MAFSEFLHLFSFHMSCAYGVVGDVCVFVGGGGGWGGGGAGVEEAEGGGRGGGLFCMFSI